MPSSTQPKNPEDPAHTMRWIDPLSLPSIEGEVARFLFNAGGDADELASLLDGMPQD